MIINVPTSEDFQNQGIWFLNLAWDSIFSLIREFEDFTDGFSEEELNKDEIRKKYWEKAKKPLSIAHALSQQGAELILKAKIAEASPFLLISNLPKEWPKECDKIDTAFADFRTIDAQDLIRVYNAVSVVKLSKEFIMNFEEFRKTRNALFHTVDGRLEFSDKIIITYILDIVNICASNQW